MKRVLDWIAAGSLTRQISILVAVAIFSTQFVDLFVIQILPPAVSGVTMGRTLTQMQKAIDAVEAASPGGEAPVLAGLSDRRMTFRFVAAPPPPTPPADLTARRVLRVMRLTLGRHEPDVRLVRFGPRYDLHMPPPRLSIPAGVGEYPKRPPGVSVDPATYDILVLPKRPTALAAKTRRGWVIVQDAEHGERVWLRRAIPDLLITGLLILPFALWVGSRIGSRLRRLTQAIEKSVDEPGVTAPDDGGPTDVRMVARAFNRMQARIRTLLEDRAMMMAAISHDVRTPLARMRFRIADLPSDLRTEIAGDIAEIDALVDALLAMTRAEHLPLHIERFDLSALAQAAVDELADAGADVAFEGLERAPIEGDVQGTRRIISNLLQNAMKYATQARVVLSAAEDGFALAVEDNGPGIPDEMAEAVFEPFRRLDLSRSREGGGSGMGLAIARHLARKAGGEVVIDPAYRSGARFVLRLPASAGAPEAAQAPA